jgi:hypothetical protein
MGPNSVAFLNPLTRGRKPLSANDAMLIRSSFWTIRVGVFVAHVFIDCLRLFDQLVSE